MTKNSQKTDIKKKKILFFEFVYLNMTPFTFYYLQNPGCGKKNIRLYMINYWFW